MPNGTIQPVSSSFGLGVALSGVIPSDAAGIAERNIAAQRKKKALDADKKAKQDKTFKKYFDKFLIDTSKIHPVFRDEVIIKGGEFIDFFIKEKATKPNTFTQTGDFARELLDLTTFVNDLRNQTVSIDRDIELLVKNPAKFGTNKEVEEAIKSGRSSVFREALKGETYQNQLLFEIVPDIDLLEDFRINVASLFDELEKTELVTVPLAGGGFKEIKKTELTEEDLSALAGIRLVNPAINATVRKRFSELDEATQKRFNNNPEEWYIDFTTPFIKKEIETRLKAPSAFGRKKAAVAAAVQLDKEFTVGDATVTAPLSISLGKGTGRATLAGEVIAWDTDTGKQIKVRKENLKFQDLTIIPFLPKGVTELTAQFLFFPALNAHIVQDKEILDKFKNEIFFKTVLAGREEIIKDGKVVGTVPVYIDVENQESFVKINYPNKLEAILDRKKDLPIFQRAEKIKARLERGTKEILGEEAPTERQKKLTKVFEEIFGEDFTEGEIPVVTSKKQWDALPSGAIVKDAQGRTFKKP